MNTQDSPSELFKNEQYRPRQEDQYYEDNDSPLYKGRNKRSNLSNLQELQPIRIDSGPARNYTPTNNPKNYMSMTINSEADNMTNISSIDHRGDLRDTVGSVGMRNLHNMLDKHDPNSTFNLNNSIVHENQGAFKRNNNANILGDLQQINAFNPQMPQGRVQQMPASANKPAFMPRKPKQSEPARFTPSYGAKPAYPNPGPYGAKNTRASLQPVSRSERPTAQAANTSRSHYLTDSMIGRRGNEGRESRQRENNYSLSSSMISGRVEIPKLRRPFKLNRPAGYKPRMASKKEDAPDLRGSYLSNVMNRKYNKMPEQERFDPLRNSNPPIAPDPTLQNFGEMRRSNSARHIPVKDDRGINVMGDMKLPSLANAQQGNFTPGGRRKRVSFNLDPRTQPHDPNRMPAGNNFKNGIPNILGDGILNKQPRTVPLGEPIGHSTVPPPRKEQQKRNPMPLPDMLAGFKMPEMPKRSGLSGLRDINPSRPNPQQPQNQFIQPNQPRMQPQNRNPRGSHQLPAQARPQAPLRQPNLGAIPPQQQVPVHQQQQRVPPPHQNPQRMAPQQPAPYQQPPQAVPQHHPQPIPQQHQQMIPQQHQPPSRHQSPPMAHQQPPVGAYQPQGHNQMMHQPQNKLDQTVLLDKTGLDTTMNPNDTTFNFTMDNSFNKEDDFLANLNEDEEVLTEEDLQSEDDDEPREVPITHLIGKRARRDSATSDQILSPPKPKRPVIKEKIEPPVVQVQEEYKASPEEIRKEIEKNRPQTYKRVTFREPEFSPADRSRFESGLGGITDKPQSILKKDSFDSSFDRPSLQPSSSKKSLSKMITDITNDEENGVVVLASSVLGALVLLLIFLVIAQ